MSNEFYNFAGYPEDSAEGVAATLRAELQALAAAADKLPPLSGQGSRIVLVNAGGTGLSVIPGVYQVSISWTPVLTCVTPGNLAVTYTNQLGEYHRIGQFILLRFLVVTSAFTHTTASGSIFLSGFPLISASAFTNFAGSMSFGGMTKAGYTNVIPVMNNNNVLFEASGSGVAMATLAITDFPTAGTVRLSGSIVFTVPVS